MPGTPTRLARSSPTSSTTGWQRCGKLFVATGMRRGEVAGLRWIDLDLGAAGLAVRSTRVLVYTDVQVVEPKTRRSRRAVSLDAGTVDALRAHRRRQEHERSLAGDAWTDSGYVFAREDGRSNAIDAAKAPRRSGRRSTVLVTDRRNERARQDGSVGGHRSLPSAVQLSTVCESSSLQCSGSLSTRGTPRRGRPPPPRAASRRSRPRPPPPSAASDRPAPNPSLGSVNRPSRYSKYEPPNSNATRRTASDLAVPGGPTTSTCSPATAANTRLSTSDSRSGRPSWLRSTTPRSAATSAPRSGPMPLLSAR